MNSTISDTAEYGCYLYNNACLPLLADFMKDIDVDVIGRGLGLNDLAQVVWCALIWMCVVLLALRVNVSLELRKTQGTW
jgi:hypothetical protein